jgi:hypothetical protein
MKQKFKDGDKARIIGNNSNHDFKKGTIVTLKTKSQDYYATDSKENQWYVNESDIEEIKKEPPVFPKDFIKNHHHIPGAIQWSLKKNSDVLISIVGGAKGLYGDGITTFEMWDYREPEPQGWLTKNNINKHLKENPL